MANKYNNHPQAGQEDMTDQRLISIRHIQKQQHHQQHQQHQQQQQQQQKQQHFSPGPGYCYPKTYYNNSNFQKLVMKSTLNPNAKEFYPSYLEPYKNGYTLSVSNFMCPSVQDYNYGGWPNYDDCDSRCFPSRRYMQGQVQRSNTVVPLMRDNYSGSGSTNVDSQSTFFQESASIDNKNNLINNNLVNKSPIFHKSDNLKSGENVWFIGKRIETSKENSNELWSSHGETKDSFSKEEYYDPQISWSDGIRTKHPENENDFIPETENKQQNNENSEDSTTSKKKLIMLYPAKKQHEHIIEGSQESIFEEPNPINYTSDESFLVKSNCNSCYNEDVNQIIREGKQFYSTNTQPTDDILDEVQDLSDDCERTAKHSDSKSYEIIERDTSKCALEENHESLPTKCKIVSKKIEVKITRKLETEKIRKVHKINFSEKDSKAHEGPPNAKEPRVPKTKKLITNCGTSKDVPRFSSKTSDGGFTGSKFSTASSTIKGAETKAKTILKTSITGAIPKTKEIAIKTTRKLPLINEESQLKSIRTLPPKGNFPKKDEKEADTRSHRLPNGFVTSRAQTRRIDAGSNNNHSEIKSIGRPDNSQKKPVPKATSRSKSVERKPAGTKNCEGCSHNSKNLLSSPSTHTNISSKKNISTTSPKDRPVQKSIIKTQMRSTTTVYSTIPTKKIIVINNAPKRDNESKKTKAGAVSRNNQSKANKATASTKIPIRQKSTSLKGVKGIIGSDGDNVKVKTSKSCVSLWSADKKNLIKGSSTSSIQIGDKLSENKKKVPSREITNSTNRHSPMKRQSVALQ